LKYLNQHTAIAALPHGTRNCPAYTTKFGCLLALAIEQGADATRNLPAAEKLSALLYDLTAGRHEPHDSDIEGRFSITKVEPGHIWLQDDEDGKDYGPILLAAALISEAASLRRLMAKREPRQP